MYLKQISELKESAKLRAKTQQNYKPTKLRGDGTREPTQQRNPVERIVEKSETFNKDKTIKRVENTQIYEKYKTPTVQTEVGKPTEPRELREERNRADTFNRAEKVNRGEN